MRTPATVAGLALAVAALGCEAGDEASSVERDTAPVIVTTQAPEERVSPKDALLLRIRSCDVRRIVFTHEGIAYIDFRERDSSRMGLGRRAEQVVTEAAFAQRCKKRIVVGIE